MTRLKPCPFCGGMPVILIKNSTKYYHRYNIACGKCGIGTNSDDYGNEQAIRDYWNTRVDRDGWSVYIDYLHSVIASLESLNFKLNELANKKVYVEEESNDTYNG